MSPRNCTSAILTTGCWRAARASAWTARSCAISPWQPAGCAMRTVQEGGATDAQRLRYAVRRCVARNPTEQEESQLLALLNKETGRFADGKLNPWDLAAANPDQPPVLPTNTTPAQLAAWTAVSRVLLNLDETITKE